MNLKGNVAYMRGLEEGKGGRKVNIIPPNKWKMWYSLTMNYYIALKERKYEVCYKDVIS